MRYLLLLLLTFNLLHAKKIALLIGNSDYSTKALSNPVNDIDLLAEKLSDDKIGFTVYKRPNLSKSKMIKELRAFYKQIDSDTIALIYFSGHGVNSTLDGKNYLMPIGGFEELLNESQLSDVAVSDSYLLGSTSGSKFSILLLDACRSNDFAQTRGDKGLGQPRSGLNNDYIISYATDIGKTAEDGYSNSPYALALSNNLLGDYPIEELFRRVRKEVSSQTRGKQKPLYKPSFNERLCLTGYCTQKLVDNSEELVKLKAENERYRRQSSVLPKAKPTPVTNSTLKWITPRKSECEGNSGKIDNDGCKASWDNAKKICRASGSSLPSIEVLSSVVDECGGELTKDWTNPKYDRNHKNNNYQRCHKNKGFASDYYWSSAPNADDSSNAWLVTFGGGYQDYRGKKWSFYVRCVRAGQ